MNMDRHFYEKVPLNLYTEVLNVSLELEGFSKMIIKLF